MLLAAFVFMYDRKGQHYIVNKTILLGKHGSLVAPKAVVKMRAPWRQTLEKERRLRL
jgi:hypothetical protein